MRARVVGQVEIDHLFNDQIARFDRQHHFGKQSGNIDTERHVGDHFLDDVALLRGVSFRGEAPEQSAEFVDFAFAAFRKVGIGNGGAARTTTLMRWILLPGNRLTGGMAGILR